MAGVIIKLKPGAVRRLLKSASVAGYINDKARKIASAVDGTAEVEEIGPNRARAAVIVYAWPGKEDEARVSLASSIDAGR